MDTVILTGANGFIGRNLTQYFVNRGFTVYGIVRSRAYNSMISDKNVHIVVCSDNNYKAIAELLPHNATAFLHLAWAGFQHANRNDIEKQKENIDLSLNAVSLANMIKAQRFILPGSTMEYAYYGKPINACAPPSPMNAYGATKVAVRFLCMEKCRKSGIPFIYTATTGIYGADRDDNNIITYTIKELLQGRTPRYTRLEQMWDYIHIDDLKEAFYCIVTRGKADAFYPIGHGDNCMLKDYIYRIRDLIAPESALEVGAIPYNDKRIPSSCVDLTALRQDTGFVPRVSFEEGIKPVIEKYRSKMTGDDLR